MQVWRRTSINSIRLRPGSESVFVDRGAAAGMCFPYDFGFLPQTLAPDGDPIDVLLLMDEPAFPGLAVPARLGGIVEGEQIDGKKRVRNYRRVAIAQANHMYNDGQLCHSRSDRRVCDTSHRTLPHCQRSPMSADQHQVRQRTSAKTPLRILSDRIGRHSRPGFVSDWTTWTAEQLPERFPTAGSVVVPW
ncbi:inorganic diphosphatase [Acidisarcina polymorpha]|uniref:inorganic diphosphatase n=1 Tax=Acidisarcina polymorpha TaxID=2211140 RepID=UPI0039C88832